MADTADGARAPEEVESSEAQIAVHWREEEYYPPPPGFIAQANANDEAILERFGVSEANWQDGIKVDQHFAHSETPHYVGRAVAALAGDANVGEKAGLALFAASLAVDYL